MVTAFGDLDGSAVAMDPRTGEVLGHGQPAGLRPQPVRQRHLQRRLPRADGQPVAAAVQPQRARRRPAGFDGEAADRAWPASTAACARPKTKVFSTGTFYIPGQRRGWRDAHGGAGWTDLRKSIAASVNFYYYKLAYDMGIERFDQYMRKYGFGEPTGIDLIGENVGVVPSPEWKRKRSKEPWYAGRDRQRRHRPGLLDRDRAAAGARHRGDRQRRQAACVRTWSPNAATATTRRGRRCRSPTPARITDNAEQPARGAGRHDRDDARPRRHRRARWRVGAPYLMAGKTGTAQKISRKGSSQLRSALAAVPPAPPGAVRRLCAGGQPDHRGRDLGRARRLRRQHRGADRAQDLRRLAAGQDARAGADRSEACAAAVADDRGCGRWDSGASGSRRCGNPDRRDVGNNALIRPSDSRPGAGKCRAPYPRREKGRARPLPSSVKSKNKAPLPRAGEGSG